MATLTETAYIARQTIKFGIVGLFAFIVLRAGYIGFNNWYTATHPKPPPPPNVLFKKIVKIKFPERLNLPAETKYKLETVSGSLPSFGSQARVYFMPKSSINLLNTEKTKTWARLVGFMGEAQKMGEYDLRFADQANKLLLDVNIITRNFFLSYDWKNDLSLTSPKNPPDEKTAVPIAQQFLTSIQSLSPDLKNGPANVVYLKYSDGDLIEVPTLFEANFVRVNLLRESIESGNDPALKPMKIKILPEDPKNANVSLLLSPLMIKNQGVIEAKFIHFPISYETVATYPIKEINQAFSELQTGKGFIAHLGSNSDGNIVIRKGYLAYYESPDQQYFLQPVFVFEGDRDFYGYVPAITNEWLAEPTAN